MSRFGTFWSLLRARRRAELRAALSRSLFPPAVYRANTLVIVRAERLRPLPRPLASIHVRWGTPADEPLLQALRRRREGYGHHFAAGRLLLLGTSENTPVSCSWVELGSVHESPANGYRFRYGADAAWLFGAEVAPAFRFAGAFHKHFVEALRLLGERGVVRAYGSVQADNPNSLGAHVRLGFEPLWTLSVTRVAGLTRHDAAPGAGCPWARERGFGAWDGRDPGRDHAPVTR